MTADAERCETFEGELSAWIDAELAPAREAQVRAHVASCAPCAARVGRLRAVDAQLRALPAPAPAPELRARLQQRIEAQPDDAIPARSETPRQGEVASRRVAGRVGAPPRRGRRLAWQAAVALAAAAAVVAVVWPGADREVASPSEPSQLAAARPERSGDRASSSGGSGSDSRPATAASRAPGASSPAPSPPTGPAAPGADATGLARTDTPASEVLDLREVSLEDLALALELEREDLDVDSVEDLEVIANLELLEALLALEEGTG